METIAPSSANRLLLIDSSGECATIATADLTLDPPAASCMTLPARSTSERLIPAIRDLAAPLTCLRAIAVVTGPGSFTGIRVGVAAAKGLSEALGLPLIALSRLAVLAQIATVPNLVTICAVLDAGRGEFYLGRYRDGKGLSEALVTSAQLRAALEDSAPAHLIVCEPAIATSLADQSPQFVESPTAAAALPLAILRLQAADFDDSATLDANYLRRTDAEIFAKPAAKAPLAGSRAQ